MKRLPVIAFLLLRAALARADAPPRLHFAFFELNSLQLDGTHKAKDGLDLKPLLLVHCDDGFIRPTQIGIKDQGSTSIHLKPGEEKTFPSQDSDPFAFQYLLPLSRYDAASGKWLPRRCPSLRLGFGNSQEEISDAVEIPIASLMEKREPFSAAVTVNAPKWKPPVGAIHVAYSLFPVKINVSERLDDNLLEQVAWIRDQLWDRNYLFVFQPLVLTVPEGFELPPLLYPPVSLQLPPYSTIFPPTYYLDFTVNGIAIGGNPLGILGKKTSGGFRLKFGEAYFEDAHIVITPNDVTLEDRTIRLDMAVDLRKSSKFRSPHLIGRSIVQPRSVRPNRVFGSVGVSQRTIQIDSVVTPEELSAQIVDEPTSLKFGLQARFMILEIVRTANSRFSLEDIKQEEEKTEK